MASQPLLLLLFSLLLLLGHFPSEAAKGLTKLPPFIHKCSIKDPNIEKCALKSGIEALPHLVKGNQTVHLPALDPLRVSEVHIRSGTEPSVFDMTSRNIVLRGFANAELLHIGIDVKNSIYSASCRVPRLEIRSDYTVDGRVILLPIKGSGKSVTVFENVFMYYEQKYTLVKRGDNYYLSFPSSSASLNCSKAEFNLENLFNGDKQLGTTVNNFLNENWRAVMDDLEKPFVDAAAEVIRKFAMVLVDKIPFNEIFDDVELP